MAHRSPRHLVPVLAAAVLLVAAACSSPPTSGGGEGASTGSGKAKLPECPLKALEDASGPTPVKLWYGGIGGPVQKTMLSMVDNFNKSQNKVKVTASNQGSSYDEVFRKFESAASANPDQLPDVVYLASTQLQTLADSKLILPAQSCMEADGYDLRNIEPAVRSAYTINDVLYPGYMNVTSQVLYYNKAHFVKAGLDPSKPPQTLDEVYQDALALKQKAHIPKPLSFKVSPTLFENWLSGEGVDMVNNGNGQDGLATKATFDTPQGKEVLAWLKKMKDQGLINVFASTEGSIDHYLALVTQQSSMLMETSTATSTIAQAISGQLTPQDVGSNFDASVIDKSSLVPGTGDLPGLKAAGHSSPGGAGFFIVNKAKPAAQAGGWKFLQYMLQPAQAKAWHIDAGYLPTVKAVADDPAVQKFWSDTLAGVLVKPAVEQLQQADPDQPGPLIGPYPDFDDIVSKMMQGVLLNGKPIDQSLARAQTQATATLKRYAG